MELDLQKIKEIRNKQGKSSLHMATKLGLKNASDYFRREKGTRKFKPEELPVLASELKLSSVEELFTEQKIAIKARKTILKPAN